MSLSPASTEVEARPDKRLTVPVQVGRAPFPKRSYIKKKRKPTDRADLDLNWRASVSRPARDRSSDSVGSEKGSNKVSVNESLNGVGSDRADRDSNWRNHPPEEGTYLIPQPSFGSKSKKKQRNKTKVGKCINSPSSNNYPKFCEAKPLRKQEQTVQSGGSGLEKSLVDKACLSTVDNNHKPCDNDSVLTQKLKPENDNDKYTVLNNNKPTPANRTSSSSLEGNKLESTSVKKSKKKRKDLRQRRPYLVEKQSREMIFASWQDQTKSDEISQTRACPTVVKAFQRLNVNLNKG